MLCPKCKIEARNGVDSEGNLVAFCRNPKCHDYNKKIAVIIRREETNPED